MIPTSSAGTLINTGQVVTSDGDTIGRVGNVYVDDADGHLTWVTVKTGWFNTNESFVPLDDATLDGDTITVPYTQDTVKNAPHFDADASLSPEEENELYSYYSISSDTHTTSDTTGQPDISDKTVPDDFTTTGHAHADTDVAPSTGSADGSTGSSDGYITRSEEQLRVGTRQVEAGRARLKKYVVTEQQTVTVPVSHEEVTLVREPIAAGEVTDAVIGEDVVEVVLTEDQVVVDKQAVPVERVRLDTETVTEQQAVTEDVRKEQIELDTDGIADNATHGHPADAGHAGSDDLSHTDAPSDSTK